MDIVNKNNISAIVDSFIEKKGYKAEDFLKQMIYSTMVYLIILDVINIILEIENTLGLNVNTENLNETINKKWFLTLIDLNLKVITIDN